MTPTQEQALLDAVTLLLDVPRLATMDALCKAKPSWSCPGDIYHEIYRTLRDRECYIKGLQVALRGTK
jgi:hypothetical protein